MLLWTTVIKLEAIKKSMGIYNSDNASHCAASFLILFRRLKPHHHCKLTNLPPSFSLLSSHPPQLIFLTVKMDLSPRKTGEIVLRKKSTFSTTLFCLMKTDQPHLLSFPPLPSLLFVTSFLSPASHRLHFNFANCLLPPTPLLFSPSFLLLFQEEREKKDFPPLPLYHLCLCSPPSFLHN